MNKATLSDEDRKQIVLYRIEKSKQTLHEAIANVDNGFVGTAANRLYYAAFYGVAALLIAHGITARSHNGVKTMFGLNFIKTGILPSSYMITFSRLFSLRMTGDYEDRRNLDMATDVLPLVEPAKQLIDKVTEIARRQVISL